MALLKTTELLVTFRDQIINSTPIANFLSTEYSGSTLTVYTGVDQKNPPGENQCPFIVIHPISATLGETAESQNYTIEINTGLLNETFSDFQASGAQEMKGIFDIDTFSHLVIEELRDLSGVQNWIADDISLTVDSITYYPIHVGTISITSSFNTVLGYDIKLTGAE